MSGQTSDPRISTEQHRKFDAVLHSAIPSLGHIFFQRRGNRPAAHATGVFVSVKREPGIVMADHSLDGDGKGPGTLLVGGPGQSDIVPLRGPRLRSTAFDPENKHRIDVAVYRLAPETVAGISAFEPFPVDAVEEPAPYLRERRFAVVGFPSSKTKTIPTSSPIRSGVMMYVARERLPSSPLKRVPWYRPDLHLVLDFETEGMAVSEGLPNPPSLSGVSGGAVLDMGSTLDPMVRPKLVGILTHHLKQEKVLVATRLHPVIYGVKE